MHLIITIGKQIFGQLQKSKGATSINCQQEKFIPSTKFYYRITADILKEMASFKKINTKVFARSGSELTPDIIYWKKYSVSILK